MNTGRLAASRHTEEKHRQADTKKTMAGRQAGRQTHRR